MKTLVRHLLSHLSADGSTVTPAGSLAPLPAARPQIEALEPRVLFSAAPVEAPDAEAADTQPEAEPGTDATTAAGASGGASAGGQVSSAASRLTPVTLVPSGGHLNAETLAAVAQAAKQRWIESGLSADQLAALESVTYEIADLGVHLGRANGLTITIDDDAAGSGAWFVDATPLLDEEFALTQSALLRAAPSGTADGRFDLLSTLLHEQGHVLGLGDLAEVRADVMGGSLATGLRRLPVDYQALGATPGSVVGDAFLDPDWTQKGSAINGEAVGDQSGSFTRSIAFSTDGSILAIGALGNDGNGTDSGHVRVYAWNGSAWVQRGTDINGEAGGDLSGFSVALSADGNTLAIGASRNDGGGSDSGHARVFVWNGTTWVQRGADLNGEAAGDRFGYHTALSDDGNTLAVSAPLNDGNGSDSGHARVFTWNGSSWVQRGVDINGEGAGDNFGQSIALSGNGNTIAIGARLNDGGGTDSGHARVFDWNGSAWIQRGTDIDGEAALDHSGYSVALSKDGNILAVGGPLNDGNGLDTGHVRVFVWSGTAWVQRGSDIEGEPAPDLTGLSGFSIALSTDGNTLAIGEAFNDGNGTDSGQVRVFGWNGTAWVQRGTDLVGVAAGDQLGWSVALAANGSTLAVGAPFNDANGSDAGQVRVYTYPSTDLSIVKSSPVVHVQQGGVVTYTINVTNYGPSAVTGARVTDGFSDLLTGVTWTAAFTPGATGNASGVGAIDELVTVPSLGSVIYAVTATVVDAGTANLAAQSIVTNTARVQTPSGVIDSNPSNNADADSDIVVLAATGGTGTFSDSGQALGNHATRSVALGDVDGDGDLDIVEGNNGQTNLVWINDGAGRFTNSGQSLGSHGTWMIALGDLDGDGDLDYVEANGANPGGFTQPNRVWINDGLGNFTDSGQLLENLSTGAIALGDLDNDGDLDLVEGNYNGPNFAWFNNGSGIFVKGSQTIAAALTESIALGDVDGDGDLDLVEGNFNQGNRVWLNNGVGSFTNSGQSLGNNATASIALGDVDGDGDLDLVEGNRNQANRVWINGGNGTFVDSGQTLGSHSEVVILGDLDADGDLDVVAGSFGNPNRVWLNDGFGVFADSGQSIGNSFTDNLALGDLDNDGALDLVEGNNNQPNRVWINEPLTHATTAVLIDNAGNLVIRDILGGSTADNVVIKRVTDPDTLIDYLSILDKTNTVGTVIPGALELKQHEVRVEWGTWSGDVIIDLRGGDDTVTFSGVLGILPGGLRVIDGAGFDRTVLKGALTLADDHDASLVSERIEGAKGGALTVGGTGSILLEATGGAGQFDGIKLSGNTLKATGSGDITLRGTSGNTGDGNDGIYLTKSTLEVATGNITLTGTGASGSVSNGNGIFLTGGTQIRQHAGGGGGLITLAGTSSASGQNANGIKLTGAASLQARGGGAIQIQGTAPDGTKGNRGVIISGFVRTESGNLTIHGSGGDNGDKNIGVVLNKATVASSNGGTLLITGTAGSGAKNNTGLSLVSSTVSTTGAGSVTLTGTGSETTKSFGMSLSKSTVSAVNGSLILTGVATATGAGGGNLGLKLSSTTLEITGTGGSGSVTLHGTGGGTLDKNAGIQLTKTGITVAGAGGIELIGEAPAGSGGGNSGVIIGAETHLNTASGDIVIEGTARGTGKNNVGVLFNKATVTATGGNIDVTGRGSVTGTETGNTGITVKGSSMTAGGGIFLTGTGGRGTKYNHGLYLYPATLNAGGSLVLLGTADSLTSGTLNTGVYAALGTVLNGGTGSNITGFGGGGAAGHGIYFKADTNTTVPLTSIVGTKGSGTGSDETGGFVF